MLVIQNVSKLFSYNWSSITKSLVPKSNKGLINPQSVKDITAGSIVRILGVIFLQVAVIGVAVYTILRISSIYGASDLYASVMPEVFAENAGKWIGQIISAAIVPIIALIFVQVMKNKQQNAWPYFILLIIAICQAVYSVYGIFGWFTSLIISPVFAIIGIISVAAALLGNISIAVGCIDFCLQIAPEAAIAPTPAQPPVMAQPVATIQTPAPIASMPVERPVVQQPPISQPVQQPPVNQPVSSEPPAVDNIVKTDNSNQ